jgi:type IV pilus assembly protein PilC
VPFAYEAVDRAGKEIADIIDAQTADEAMEQLHSRGLFVTRVSHVEADSPGGARRKLGSLLSGRAGNTRDRMLLTQQMAMMLHAGSQVVPALTAIQSQIENPAWRKVVEDVCQKVETGAALSAALSDYPAVFDQTFRAIVSAGESTGSTAEAFDRLAAMTKTQQEIKLKVIGALIYPAVLLLMSLSVVGTLMFYVLPKFDDMYKALGTRLPAITTVMIAVSRWITGNKAIAVLGAAALIAAPAVMWRLPTGKKVLDQVSINLPLISRVIQRIILAKIFRVWGTLVHSNVPLLEALRLSRDSTNNDRFLVMMDDLIRSVEEGDPVGESLARNPLVPATLSSAISTGEQTGQLGESLIFLADYLDQENGETIATLTRLVEPLILVLMGAVVGTIAISLFLPLFEMTSAVSAH